MHVGNFFRFLLVDIPQDYEIIPASSNQIILTDINAIYTFAMAIELTDERAGFYIPEFYCTIHRTGNYPFAVGEKF
jgi:hypothetical protein